MAKDLSLLDPTLACLSTMVSSNEPVEDADDGPAIPSEGCDDIIFPFVRLPLDTQSMVQRVEEEVTKLEARLERNASTEELAVGTGLGMGVYLCLLEEVYPLSLSSYGGVLTIPATTDEERQKVLKEFVSENCVQQLAGGINSLPVTERLVLTLYFYDDLNAKEIALVMGLPECDIKHMHTQAMFRLRGRMRRFINNILNLYEVQDEK